MSVFEVKVQTVSERAIVIEAPCRAIAEWNVRWRLSNENEKIVSCTNVYDGVFDRIETMETWKIVEDICLDISCEQIYVSYVGDVENPWLSSTKVFDKVVTVRTNVSDQTVIAKAMTHEVLNKFKIKRHVDVDEIAKIYDIIHEKIRYDSTAQAEIEKEEEEALDELLI